jgi:hypothetical protein
MMRRRVLRGVLILTLVITFTFPKLSRAQTEEEALRANIEQVYSLIRGLPSDKVLGIVDGLNKILDEVAASSSSASSSQWASWSARVQVYRGEAENIRQDTSAEGNVQVIVIAAQLIILAGLCYSMWKFFPRFFWSRWLKLRGDWRVVHED